MMVRVSDTMKSLSKDYTHPADDHTSPGYEPGVGCIKVGRTANPYVRRSPYVRRHKSRLALDVRLKLESVALALLRITT